MVDAAGAVCPRGPVIPCVGVAHGCDVARSKAAADAFAAVDSFLAAAAFGSARSRFGPAQGRFFPVWRSRVCAGEGGLVLAPYAHIVLLDLVCGHTG